MTKSFLIAVAVFVLFVIPAAAQDACGIYSLSPSSQQANGTLTVTVSAYSDCFNPSTSVSLNLTGPNGTPQNSGSGSGAAYAYAQASISTANLAGLAQYSGSAMTRDTCWEDSGESFGYSGTVRLNDPTPNITSINPSTWQAGMTNYPVTITGANFGSMPTLTTDDSSGGITFTYVSRSNTQIVANVTISSNTPPESVNVTVTSTGYNGLGFVSTTGNSPQSPSKTVSITSTLFAAYGFDIAVLGPVTGVSTETNSVVSGQGFPVRVTAKSSDGSVATYYVGTIHFSSGDLAASLPHDYTFTGLDHGTHDFSNVILKTVTGNSPTRDITVSDISANVSSTQNVFVWFNVVASREGLVGSQTATGHIISTNDHFVALPTSGALNLSVRLLYGGNTAETAVLDRGPWCPHSVATSGNPCVCGDDSYWQSTGLPFVVAATCDSDNAAIDLADGTFYDLGLSGNGLVYWRFK